MYYSIYKNNRHDFIITGDESGIHGVFFFSKEKLQEIKEKNYLCADGVFFAVTHQLDEFFKGKRRAFELTLNPQGTIFQKKVWNALRNIPFGETRSYQDIAKEIGHDKAVRAVGTANKNNPIAIIVPCHRVIGKDGTLGGYNRGIELKRKILDLEKLYVIYQNLLKAYGKQNWWPAESDYEMMIGAVLTQNTSWANVEKAINQLRGYISPNKIKDMTEEKLGECIRSSGYYNQKATRIKLLTKWFETYDYKIEKAKKKSAEELRFELLAISGIGKETADSVLTYALDKPHFIIDTYTRRIFYRIGFDVPKEYDEFRKWIEVSIAEEIYGEYHALIVKHAKEHCCKIPRCEACPLVSICQKRI